MVNVFVQEGKLHPLWRAILFVVIGNVVLFPATGQLVNVISNALHIPLRLDAVNLALGDGQYIVVTGIMMLLFTWYERQRIDAYGLPIRQAFGKRFWEGICAGLVVALFIAVAMLAFGGMKISGLALHGPRLIGAALAWAFANIVVGIGEESWYRGYALVTLRKAIGFWPAAIALALFFTSDHYFFKAGENLYDALSVFSFGMLAAYSFLRTGSLWFAVGLHAAFDFMQFFIIGTRNGTVVPTDHLLNVTFPGPAWINGGVLGTEASVFFYPGVALLFVYVWWRTRNVGEAS